MAADDYTSLLGRSNQSWGELAGTLLAEQKGKNKKAKSKQRKALVAGLLLSAWDNKKVNNVIRNLKEADVDKQYEIAEATSKWDAYNTFVTEDRGYVAAGGKKGNYFDTQAAIDFNKANPNFDDLYKNQRGRHAIRQDEITTRSEALKASHEKQRNTLNIDASQSQPYLTREKFLKPYEDFYRTKQSRATDPSELSAVHSLFGLVGPAKKRRQALDEKLIAEENIIKALDKTYEGLLDPKNYGKAVTSFYDPDAIKYSQADALSYVQRTFGPDEIITKKLQNDIMKIVSIKDNPNTAIKENEISDTDLNALVISSTLNFDNLTEQAVQLKDSFQEVWKTKNNKEELPFTVENGVKIYDKKNTDIAQQVRWYEDEEDIYVQTKLKLYTPDSLELRQAILNRNRELAKDNSNTLLIRNYEQTIEKATTLSGFEAATQEYMRIRIDPSKLAQFNTAYNVVSDQNKDGITAIEARTQYLQEYVDTLNSMRSK